MEPARRGLEEFLSGVSIYRPRRPVIANVTAEPVTEPDQIRTLLIKQVTSPVRWAQTMAWLKHAGVTRIFEIGPGRVLTGLAKREMQPQESINLDTLTDITALAPAR